MNVRGNFELELKTLKSKVIQQGKSAEYMLDEVIKAFNEQSTPKMDYVINYDININMMELEINEAATVLIAKQQPVASDLRKIIVAMKISSDLERVADLTVDIAKGGKRIDIVSFNKHIGDLNKIADAVKSMLTLSLEAFETVDVLMAQKIATLDDHVDKMYGEFIRQLFQFVTNQADAEQATQIAFILRYLERIADYATNIAEWVIYEVNGKHFDLN
ncbi:phosphate signaling complex protein PhoU [Anaerobacillus sp. MEB173]|uniref:phosphate signaling complex protein PhoU n=1 Tax=Anaerobacillus sp. MEB173 TaxID=3383345 RepID=UPI003F90124B